jgi:hypothetical protein
MVQSRLRQKVLVKLEAADVWVRFRALRINLVAQSLKNTFLMFGRGLIEAGH